jgi:hypothetical protein
MSFSETTWKDIKRATLQRMFVIEGGTVVISDITNPYIEALPAAANEGIYLLAAAGGAGIKSLSFEKKRSDGTYSRFDMNKYADDFRSFTDEIYIQTDKGRQRIYGYVTEADCVLVLPAWLEGEIVVYYNPLPQIIPQNVSDDEVIRLLPMASTLLPLYIASQLFKDDDMRQAVQLRNEFEIGLSRMAALISSDRKKKERFTSVTGWN